MSQALAQPVKPGFVQVQLLAEQTTIVPGKPVWVGLSMLHDKGWHTYWKNPGDAGLPPTITWMLPKGLSAGEIEWPYPERIQVGSLASYGYEGRHLLPMLLFADRSLAPGTQIEIKAKAQWLVCKESCLPEEAELGLNLRVATKPERSPQAARFLEARRKLPQPVANSAASATRNASAIRVQIALPAGYLAMNKPGELFFDREDFVEPGIKPKTWLEGGAIVWESSLTPNGRRLPAQALRAVWVASNAPQNNTGNAALPRAVRLTVKLR
jgi:DsbC/DsbD-like thiol-disulfide interchange protein